MSFALDRVAVIDEELEHVPISALVHPRDINGTDGASEQIVENTIGDKESSARIQHLQSLIKSLSRSSEKKLRSDPSSLVDLLTNAKVSFNCDTCHRHATGFQPTAVGEDTSDSSYEHALEWLLIGKVANHAYGLVIDALIDQTLTLNNEIWYWSDVVGSDRYLGLYYLQTSPLRFFYWSKSVYEEILEKHTTLTDGWRQFYDLVKSTIRKRSLLDVQRQISSPSALLRSEVRQRLTSLHRFRLLNSSGIGYLMNNGFHDESLGIGRRDGLIAQNNLQTWKGATVKSIYVMDAVLTVAGDDELSADDFDAAMNTVTNEDPLEEYHRALMEPNSSLESLSILLNPSEAALRLEGILLGQLPQFSQSAALRLNEHSRPSVLIRYWIPAAALLISSTTLFRICVNRKAELLQWIRDVGSTVVDFWSNWVVEPTRKVIGTIRHDEKSEVSIMSKRSLEGDRASLERMVLDFATENPEGPPLSDSEINDIRLKVKEGDLTPVLRAYERELKSPFYSSVRGNLIRTLLIQVQKTKVDVEVAMGGIDNLLKSQELVFGFVGLTPGVLVCLGVFRWLRNLPSSRRHSQQLQKQSQAYLVLRNIDRVLTSAPQSDTGSLSFKDFGILVCEAIVLRDVARKTFPRRTFQEFLQDFDDLIDSNSGVGRQLRVADRIRWAYAKWL